MSQLHNSLPPAAASASAGDSARDLTPNCVSSDSRRHLATLTGPFTWSEHLGEGRKSGGPRPGLLGRDEVRAGRAAGRALWPALSLLAPGLRGGGQQEGQETPGTSLALRPRARGGGTSFLPCCSRGVQGQAGQAWKEEGEHETLSETPPAPPPQCHCTAPSSPPGSARFSAGLCHRRVTRECARSCEQKCC